MIKSTRCVLFTILWIQQGFSVLFNYNISSFTPLVSLISPWGTKVTPSLPKNDKSYTFIIKFTFCLIYHVIGSEFSNFAFFVASVVSICMLEWYSKIGTPKKLPFGQEMNKRTQTNRAYFWPIIENKIIFLYDFPHFMSAVSTVKKLKRQKIHLSCKKW